MSTAGRELHIDAPELLSRRERARDVVITAVMWSIYLYLWMPLISLCAWLFGIEIAYDVMVRSGGAQNLGSVLMIYFGIVFAIFATVTIWSLGNLLRYGKKNRRTRAKPTSIEEMAEYFDIETEIVQQLRLTPSVAIEFTADGHPIIKRHEALTVGDLTRGNVPVMPLGRGKDGSKPAGEPQMVDTGLSADSKR